MNDPSENAVRIEDSQPATTAAPWRRISTVIGVLAAMTVSLAPVTPAGARTPTARSVIRGYMHRTIEVGSGRRFQPIGQRRTIRDGHGGSITAQVAIPNPTADGHGDLVFFFRGKRFLGWDADHEALSIQRLAVEGDAFRVRYSNYGAGDPLCCPSQRAVSVTYRWKGRLRSSGPTPRPRGARVKFEN